MHVRTSRDIKVYLCKKLKLYDVIGENMYLSKFQVLETTLVIKAICKPTI